MSRNRKAAIAFDRLVTVLVILGCLISLSACAESESPREHTADVEKDNEAIRTAASDPWSRLVVQSDGFMHDNHQWRGLFVYAGVSVDRVRAAKEYWVAPTAGIVLSGSSTAAQLKPGYYFLHGFAVGDEKRLVELLLEEVRLPRVRTDSTPTLPLILEDLALGLRFVGEAGVVGRLPGSQPPTIHLQRLVAQAPCPPPQDTPNTCSDAIFGGAPSVVR